MYSGPSWTPHGPAQNKANKEYPQPRNHTPTTPCSDPKSNRAKSQRSHNITPPHKRVAVLRHGNQGGETQKKIKYPRTEERSVPDTGVSN